MSELLALPYFLMAAVLAWVLFNFIRRSEFGILIAYVEFFTFMGLFVYPVFFYLGFISPALEGVGFAETTGKPGILTTLHVACYLLGAISGVAIANRTTSQMSVASAYAMAGRFIRDDRVFFATALGLGAGTLLLYMSLVGWKDAIVQAASLRVGDLENIDANAQRLLFLKSLAFSFTFVICFVPAALRRGSDRLLLLGYVVFAILLYAVSVSRTVILLTLVVPLLIYVRTRSASISTFMLWCVLLVPVLLLFLLYGKPLGFVLYMLISDGELVSIEPYLSEYGIVSAFFGNFEHLWLSIQAGITHFTTTEAPLVPIDVLLAVGGFIPSWMLSYLGMSHLDYRMVATPLSCINSAFFGFNCTIPPRDVGMAAYILPGGGAFVLGLIKYFVFRRQEKYFLYTTSLGYGRTWYPFMAVIFFTMLLSFVPSVVSEVVFLLISFFVLAAALRLLRFVSVRPQIVLIDR